MLAALVTGIQSSYAVGTPDYKKIQLPQNVTSKKAISASSLKTFETNYPIFVIELKLENVARVLIEVDLFGAIEEFSPVSVPIKETLKNLKDEKVLNNLLLKHSLKILAIKLFPELEVVKQKLTEKLKTESELTSEEIKDAFVGFDGTVTVEGHKVHLHIGIEHLLKLLFDFIPIELETK